MNDEHTYAAPESVEEAMNLATQSNGDFCYIAGGTDVMLNRFQGNEKSRKLIDLSGISELLTINKAGGYLHIGALVTLEELSSNKTVLQKFPSLGEAADSIATPVLRKTATVGGNLLCENRCMFYNQSEWWRDAIGNCLKCDGDVCLATGGKKNCFSKFVSDLAPVFIALESTVSVLDDGGGYICPLEDIYTGNGLKPRKVNGTSLLTSVHVPLVGNHRCVFRKLRVRKSVDFTSLTTAVSVNDSGKLRMVLGGVDPKPVVVKGSLKDDTELLIEQAVKKARIVENDVFPRAYRKEMIAVYLRSSLKELH